MAHNIIIGSIDQMLMVPGIRLESFCTVSHPWVIREPQLFPLFNRQGFVYNRFTANTCWLKKLLMNQLGNLYNILNPKPKTPKINSHFQYSYSLERTILCFQGCLNLFFRVSCLIPKWLTSPRGIRVECTQTKQEHIHKLREIFINEKTGNYLQRNK